MDLWGTSQAAYFLPIVQRKLRELVYKMNVHPLNTVEHSKHSDIQ
jgi:hypothetical protein